MSYFVDTEARHRIYLKDFDGSDEWFEIPEEQTRRNILRLAEQTAELKAVLDENGTTIGHQQVLRLDRNFDAVMGIYVKAWSFKNAKGKPAPINATTIGQLKGPIGEWMVQQINQYYQEQQRSDDERKNSESEPSAITSETGNSPGNWGT